jgi:hypothetical protein
MTGQGRHQGVEIEKLWFVPIRGLENVSYLARDKLVERGLRMGLEDVAIKGAE